MKNYHVTRKLQITIPKVLAEELGIRPGDSVAFERAGGAVLVKKAGYQARGYAELKQAVETLAKDMENLRRHVKMAERALAENLSGHIGSERQIAK